MKFKIKDKVKVISHVAILKGEIVEIRKGFFKGNPLYRLNFCG